jgi:hypothetical protein
MSGLRVRAMRVSEGAVAVEDYSEDVEDALDDAAEEINDGWRVFGLKYAAPDQRGYAPVPLPSSAAGEILSGRLLLQVPNTAKLVLTIAEFGEKTRQVLRQIAAFAILRPEISETTAYVYEFDGDSNPSVIDADGRWNWVLTFTDQPWPVT